MPKNNKKSKPKQVTSTTKDALKWWGNKLFGQGGVGQAAKELEKRKDVTKQDVKKLNKGK